MRHMKRICLAIPKPLLDQFDRLVLADGRRRAEVIRTLIVNFVREERGIPKAIPHAIPRGITR